MTIPIMGSDALDLIYFSLFLCISLLLVLKLIQGREFDHVEVFSCIYVSLGCNSIALLSVEALIRVFYLLGF